MLSARTKTNQGTPQGKIAKERLQITRSHMLKVNNELNNDRRTKAIYPALLSTGVDAPRAACAALGTTT